MAGAAGLEPTHDGIKIRCLTDLAMPLYRQRQSYYHISVSFSSKLLHLLYKTDSVIAEAQAQRNIKSIFFVNAVYCRYRKNVNAPVLDKIRLRNNV